MKRLEEEQKRVMDSSNRRDKLAGEVNVEEEDVAPTMAPAVKTKLRRL